MTPIPSGRLQVGGHRFLMRRMEYALLYGEADGDPGPMVAPRIWFAVGAAVAGVAMAVSLTIELQWPSSVPVIGPQPPGG